MRILVRTSTSAWTGRRHVAVRLLSTRWALAAVYGATGEPSSVMRVVARELPQELGASEVAIRMLAAPVNPSDLNQIEGTYPVRGRFADVRRLLADGEGGGGCVERLAVGGNEGVGVVEAVGAAVRDVRAGEWVVPAQAGEFGTWCTHAVVGRAQVIRIADQWREGVDAAVVAALKVNASTAYRLLRDFGDLQAGDWVIQNGANSGVGRAVIQLARARGVHTVNVVRDRGADAHAQLADELQRLGADVVVRDTELGSAEFRERMRALGSPRVALNCVGGRAALAMARHVAEGAWLVTYGAMARQPVVLPASLLLFRDVRACGFWMNRWYAQHAAAERDDMWRAILALARERRFEAPPMQRVPWPAGLRADAAQELVRAAVAWDGGAKRLFEF
ncbi:mitochondrial 2-enoyl thioester reductase [Coemansia thaxteri]|nr:mitochondrial 2-enoyl thioester reductase [Coemansia thaxteri]